ncbi:uncharacterized protein LOC112494995 [Cephus cinctus]|uniref:Uncharacterized protein LOC112494995 n=1 Tax=Cephus cinctus TaxID=211228 RepID=A0AAJ7RQ43_CEPCN|nr:uncharacterized protein LOC112494995 [Cephus cinctus]
MKRPMVKNSPSSDNGYFLRRHPFRIPEGFGGFIPESTLLKCLYCHKLFGFCRNDYLQISPRLSPVEKSWSMFGEVPRGSSSSCQKRLCEDGGAGRAEGGTHVYR